MSLQRREFLGATLAGGAGAILSTAAMPQLAPAAEPAPPQPAAAIDPTAVVPLGKHLKVCRLGAGTGMRGGNRESNHTRMGAERFDALIQHEYEQGVRLFDLADLYGTHTHFARAMKGKPRDSYQIISKIWVRTGGVPEKERPDADVLVKRFLKELQAEAIDILQIHCMTTENWPTEQSHQMEVMDKLKKQGLIRAHGVSIHSLAALKLAAEEPWVDVIHARINKFGHAMDAKPELVVPVVKKARENGKGIIGMKLVGEGKFTAEQRAESMKWVVEAGLVDAYIVGFEQIPQVAEFKTLLGKELQAAVRRKKVAYV